MFSFWVSGSAEFFISHCSCSYNCCRLFPALTVQLRLVAPIPNSTLSWCTPLIAAGCEDQMNKLMLDCLQMLGCRPGFEE